MDNLNSKNLGLITSQNDTAPKPYFQADFSISSLITSQNDTAPKLPLRR